VPVIALAKNRTLLGLAHPSRIRRPFSSIPSVRSSSLTVSLLTRVPSNSTLPFLPFFSSTARNRGRTGRWYDQLCARLPLRVHIHRPSRPAHPSPRGDIQPLSRASLQRRTRRRFLPAHPHARTCHRHRHRNWGPTASSARTSKRAAAALAGGRAHRGRVGLGSHTGTNTS
jgi:hypothetical protein